jgi:hypothetical protein
MTLELSKIVSQVGDMVLRHKSDDAERREHLRQALARLSDKSTDLEKLKYKIATCKLSPVAGLVGGLNGRYPAPPLPPEFTVIATDGSHIDVDRHHSARCFLINIGAVVLRYGASPDASLESYPRLYSDDSDLVIACEGNRRREQDIQGALLDVKRSVEECRKLAELAAEIPPETKILALLDGSLVMWSLSPTTEDFIAEELLHKGFLRYLDDIRKLEATRKLAFASYTSLPRSSEVSNMLRIIACPHEVADCEKYCLTVDASPCDIISGIQDRTLFSAVLQAGERSDLFISPSQIVKKHYGAHQVYFFYLKGEEEIARVEMPEWVARNPELLDLTHTLVLDQCRRGNGYPVALSEAHEQAVVTGADRDRFWQLVESYQEEEKLPTYTSIKSRSKKTRWL